MRHLKPSQVLARLWLKAGRPRPDLRPAPRLRAPTTAWRSSPPKTARFLSPTRARFLNVERDIAIPSAWNDPACDKLWLYNLHYFDDLARPDYEAWRERHLMLMRRWVAENPPSVGVGWEPYPLSLRITNWIKWHLCTGGLDSELQHSLAVQTRYLCRRLERHLLGNHLLANAKAIALSGMLFNGSEAAGWLRLGMRLLDEQLREQVLPDGGHFELSPMYHAVILEDALDFVNAATVFSDAFDRAQTDVVAHWRDALRRMLAWLATMTHPDGEIGFFNDAAQGIALPLAALQMYARKLGIVVAPPTDATVNLGASGYVRLESGPAVLLADVGRVGPDYNPGHAHADTLSFELSLFGQRVIVNCGTSRYGIGKQREVERATAAHSTVEVDGQNSSEVWGGFRVARRARPFDLAVSAEKDCLRVSCAHDGYRRLGCKAVHRRTWELITGSLTVEDRLEGGFQRAAARFHLHPAIGVTLCTANSGTLQLPCERQVGWQVFRGTACIEPSFYCPEFGCRITSKCLVVQFEGPISSMEFRW